jgi:hypothetical protein
MAHALRIRTHQSQLFIFVLTQVSSSHSCLLKSARPFCSSSPHSEKPTDRCCVSRLRLLVLHF